MTNSEAISNLNHIYGFVSPDIQRSLDVAIKALEERPQEVYMNGKDYNLYLEGYKQGKKDFERPQSEWISAEDELPEDMQRVLIWFEYYRYGDFNCMYQTYGFGYVCDGKWSPFINGETGWQDYKVIAWQPLPEPYQKGE